MALGTILLAVSILLLIVAEWLRRRAAKRQGIETTLAGV